MYILSEYILLTTQNAEQVFQKKTPLDPLLFVSINPIATLNINYIKIIVYYSYVLNALFVLLWEAWRIQLLSIIILNSLW